MNITYILLNFPKLSETFILDEITGVIDSGHEVNILSIIKPKESQLHEDIVKYKLLQKTIYLEATDNPPYANLEKYEILVTISKSHLFISHFAKEASFLTNELHKMYNIPYIFFTHAYDIFISPDPGKIRELVDHSEKCLTVSNFNKDYMTNLIGDDFSHKIDVIYNAIDIDSFKYKLRTSKSICKIISIGRFVPKKGLLSSINGFARACKNCDNIHYTIIGDGPLSDEIKKLITDLGIEDKIELKGALPRNKVMELVLDSDIFLLTSEEAEDGDKEGMPVVILEAMATGMPVISTYHTGIPEAIVNDESGILVKEKDIDSIANAITRLARNYSLRKSMGLNGRKCAEKLFDLRRRNNDIENIITDIKTKFYLYDNKTNKIISEKDSIIQQNEIKINEKNNIIQQNEIKINEKNNIIQQNEIKINE